MSNEVKINCYTIKYKRKGAKNVEGNFESFSGVNLTGTTGSPISFADFFKLFVESFEGHFIGFQRNNTYVNLDLDGVKFDSGKEIIYGFFKGGYSGLTRTVLKRSKANDDPVYVIQNDDVDSIEYAYLIHLPSDSKVGLLFVQGYSDESYAEVFKTLFMKFFKDSVESSTLVIGRYTPNNFVKEMTEKGSIDKIVLKNNALRSDKANQLLGTTFIESDVILTITVSRLKSYSEKIKDLVLGKDANAGRFFTSEVLEEIGIGDSNEVTIEYNFAGKTATAKKTKNYTIYPNIYVDESSIERQSDGHLTRPSIIDFLLGFFHEIKSEMTSIK